MPQAPDTTQRVRHLPGIKPLTWSAGGTDSQDIKPGYVLREIHLRLSFTLTTSANVAAAAIAAGAEWGLVKKIRIIAGSELIREYTGEELRFLNAIWYGAFPRPRIALGATSTAVESTLKLPFWDRGGYRPMDTALNTNNYAGLRIEVVWGTFTDVASTGTAFSVTPTIDWSMWISTFGPDTPANQRVFMETRVQRLQNTLISSAQTDFAIPLPTANFSIRDMLIYAKDSSGADLAGKITDVKLTSLTTTFLQAKFASLRDGALSMRKLRDGVVSGAKASPFQDAQFDLDNWLYLDFAQDEMLSETFGTMRIPELQLKLTTNAQVNNLYVVMTQLYPPPAPIAG